MLALREGKTVGGGKSLKKLGQAFCGMAAAFGWLNLQWIVFMCAYAIPNRPIPYVVCGVVVQILCWAALLHCVKGGSWKGPAVPISCGIFTLIDLWWVVRTTEKMLWYYYGFPRMRMEDVLGILGVLLCAAGMCINIIAAVHAVRSRKKPNKA